jgi:hypothetical protein
LKWLSRDESLKLTRQKGKENNCRRNRRFKESSGQIKVFLYCSRELVEVIFFFGLIELERGSNFVNGEVIKKNWNDLWCFLRGL